MGLSDRLLRKNEEKIFDPLVSALNEVIQEVKVEKAEIGCSKNTGFMHAGMGIFFPDGERLYLHRCMNKWISTNNSIGLNAMEFFMQFKSPQEAQTLLTNLIIDTTDAKKSNTESDHNSAEQFGDFTDQDDDQAESSDYEKGFLRLRNLYLSSGMQKSRADEIARDYAQTWVERVQEELSGEQDEKLGRIMDNGQMPATKHGMKNLELLKLRKDSLNAHGISRQEVIEWWDRTCSDRHFLRVQHEMLLQNETERRYEALTSSSGATPQSSLAFLQAICIVPLFGYWTDEEYKSNPGPLAPFPWEMYDKVMEFLLSKHPSESSWRVEAIEARSFNAYYRQQHGLSI